LKPSKAKKQPISKSKQPQSRPETDTKQSQNEETNQYRLLIAPHFDERKQRNTTKVVLETATSFASFRYELTVEEKVTPGTIAYRILGLNAPQLSLPAAGPARFVREYDHLAGSYDLSVQGLDGKTCTVRVRIRPTDVRLVKLPAGAPIQVVTDERLWPTD
jgi:hypothetical protein